jgi:thiosulfate dehydrogenase (quinone) large subunit
MKSRKAFDAICESGSRGLLAMSLLLMRFIFGLLFFLGGLSKLTADWTAAGYLAGATGPFAEIFQAMAGSSIVDSLNSWGMFAIGIALLLGLFLRSASYAAIVMMILYYFAHFDQNTANGLIDQHIVYSFALLVLIGSGIGNVFGVDAFIERTRFVQSNRWVKWLLG